MLKTIVEFKFDDYQLYEQKMHSNEGGILVQKLKTSHNIFLVY